jgi:hypothetical protein
MMMNEAEWQMAFLTGVSVLPGSFLIFTSLMAPRWLMDCLQSPKMNFMGLSNYVV